jgi:septal ring factor EnvC (AmiA/AmiB activator)
MNRNSRFVELYAQRTGVSTEEATAVAATVCWLFAIESPDDIDLDCYIDADQYNQAEKLLADAEDENAKLQGQIDDLARERDEFAFQVKELEIELAAQNKRINELEAANGTNDN